MTVVERTTARNDDFLQLVKELDAYLSVTDGEEHAFYNLYNKLDDIEHVIILYVNNKPAACGALKRIYPDTIEVKRMYTREANRLQGFASAVLYELEQWARELSYKRCVLETGKRQVEAIGFYKKMKYVVIPNYEQYAGMDNSVCFEKEL